MGTPAGSGAGAALPQGPRVPPAPRWVQTGLWAPAGPGEPRPRVPVSPGHVPMCPSSLSLCPRGLTPPHVPHRPVPESSCPCVHPPRVPSSCVLAACVPTSTPSSPHVPSHPSPSVPICSVLPWLRTQGCSWRDTHGCAPPRMARPLPQRWRPPPPVGTSWRRMRMSWSRGWMRRRPSRTGAAGPRRRGAPGGPCSPAVASPSACCSATGSWSRPAASSPSTTW